MLEFIQLLKQRYQAVSDQQSQQQESWLYQRRIEQLILAEAYIRKGQWLAGNARRALQIAVLGPTQAGKSSIVNVLLASQLAEVSPLAGYTVHAQGFCHGVTLSECQDLQRYFGRFQCLSQTDLNKQRFDCYSLTQNTGVSKLLPDCVLWDTPDFDSINSSTYREGVIRTIALADVVVIVVSKEKYADQSVWDLIALLEVLQQPMCFCLNKLSEGSETLLIKSLQEKWSKVRADAFPDIVPLYYQTSANLPIWPKSHHDVLLGLAKQVRTKKHLRLEQQLLQKYWPEWLQPIREEHQALTDWHALLDTLIEQALDNYQRDFLNHPHHYETFQHALAELLILLEVPGLADFLGGVRKVLTWPVRKIFRLERKSAYLANTSQEIFLLNQIAEHLLIQLTDHIMNNMEQSKQRVWWQHLRTLLQSQRSDILKNFSLSAKNYHLSFQQDVEQIAHSMYHKLQQQPLVLNGLRATRVTADAAVIAVALHTGGIGIHDLVIAPAMLTLTSLLAESAIGGYMHKLENQLKQQQLTVVKQTLFMDTIGKKLGELPEQLVMLPFFNISPSQLLQAEQQLTEKRHGLRLL